MDPLSSLPPKLPQRENGASPAELQPKRITPNVAPPPESSMDPPGEKVSLSSSSQDLPHYLERLSQLPDVRPERIAEIQKALKSGTYVISSEDLADNILHELSSRHQHDSSLDDP